MNISLISFGNLSSNKNLNSIYIAGNFDSFLSKNLILTLLVNSLFKK